MHYIPQDVHRGELLPRRLDERHGRAQRRRVHHGVLLPRGLPVRKRRHKFADVHNFPQNLHRGVLLPRGLRVRQRRHEFTYMHDEPDDVHMRRRILLPKRVTRRSGCRLYRRKLLYRQRCAARGVHRGVLLPCGLRLRQRRHQRWMQPVTEDV